MIRSMPDRAHFETAIRLLADRKDRESLFGSELFGEYAWDILLALYIASDSDTAITIGRLMEQTCCVESVGRRWLACLEKRALVRTEPPGALGEIVRVSLTERALHLLDAYLAARQPAVPWG